MTRETKISLLVGLAFIIVIGILLSDYNRNESPTASLPQVVADNVKNSTATLRNGSADSAVVPPPAPVAPTRPLATHDELNPVTHIEVGPSGASPATGNAGNEHGPVRPMTPVTDNTPPAPLPPTPTNGGDLVPYSPHPPIAPPATPSVPTVNGAKAYVAVESDTLNKLAGRFLGANTKANREAIMAINPSLKANPNNIVVGRTYMIPPIKSTTTTVASVPTPPIHPLTPAAAPAPTVSEAQNTFYIVKPGDSLWKIASEQCGQSSAIDSIKELNRDVLKGTDDVRPNMKLRLPAKLVASAN